MLSTTGQHVDYLIMLYMSTMFTHDPEHHKVGGVHYVCSYYS